MIVTETHSPLRVNPGYLSRSASTLRPVTASELRRPAPAPYSHAIQTMLSTVARQAATSDAQVIESDAANRVVKQAPAIINASVNHTVERGSHSRSCNVSVSRHPAVEIADVPEHKPARELTLPPQGTPEFFAARVSNSLAELAESVSHLPEKQREV